MMIELYITDRQLLGTIMFLASTVLVYVLGRMDERRKYVRKRDGKGRFVG